MKSPKIIIKKILIGSLLVFCSAILSLVIKDVIDSTNPQTSLPTLTVSSAYISPIISDEDASPLIKTSLVRANYSWRFITGKREGPSIDLAGCALEPETFQENSPIIMEFSIEPESIKISRANGRYGPDFYEIKGDVISPNTKCEYCYKIEAQFARGSILYYLSVKID